MTNRETRQSVSIPAIRISQPIGDFFIGVMDSRVLREICWFDIRSIRKERGIDTFLGIQRTLNKKRVTEIKQYATGIDATFPTGVILAVEETCAQVEILDAPIAGKFCLLTLSNYPDPEDENERVLFREIAKVIDGQHRIEGLEDYGGSPFELNVTIFVGADVAEQASIFATVNLAQTKVNRSLVYDLLSYTQSRSPEKTCHEIAVALDGTEGSPFFHRIKRLGVSTEGRFGETVSQATFVKGLLPYLTKNAAADRDAIKRGKKLDSTNAEESSKLIFRNFFVSEQDAKIANIVWNFFEAVSARWPLAWKSTGRGNMLNRTNGYDGFVRFLRPAYLHFTTTFEDVSKEQFLTLLGKVELSDADFNIEQFKPGTAGASDLYRKLISDTEIEE